VDDREVWRKVHPDIPKDRAPSETPLIVGKDRAYFAGTTSSGGYDLVAYKLQDGEELYRAPLIAKRAYWPDDIGYPNPRRPALALIRLGQGDEHIVQFDSTRLITPIIGNPTSFSVINGADGQVVQTIDNGDHGPSRFANSTPTSFTLVACPFARTVTLRTFSRQSNGLFSQTWACAVAIPQSIWAWEDFHVAINPHTMQAFSVERTVNAITLVPTERPETLCQDRVWVVPEPEVDEYFQADAGTPVTLPPRARPGRRAFDLSMDNRSIRLASLDERHLVIWNTGRDDAVYVVDFTAQGETE
jgi:hypothetical protein